MKNIFGKKVIYAFGGILIALILILGVTYAITGKNPLTTITGSIVAIDEEAFGKTEFNSKYYELSPIKDDTIKENNKNVIKFGFRVGGSKENNAKNIIYNISLAELEIDCELLSPYLKWRLYKNREVLSEGSFDYKFDTIVNKRLVLNDINQELKPYSEDKTTYDWYDIYIWLSDSCQEDDLINCVNSETQNELTGRNIKGRINIELLVGNKKELKRNPSNTLNKNSCTRRMENKNG